MSRPLTRIPDPLPAPGLGASKHSIAHLENVPFEATGEALRRLVDLGRIRHVGVSNFDAEQMQALSRAVPVEALQPRCHVFRRDIEGEILPYAEEHDIGVLAYGPLAHGLLSGRMTAETGFAEDERWSC